MLFLLLSVALSINMESIDFDGQNRALAEMLFSLNPVASMTHDYARWLRTAPRMQALDQRPELVSADIAASGRQGSMDHIRNRVDAPILVQGGTLKTWSYNSAAVERVQVYLTTEGRPLDADIELWQGPDNTPTKMRVYSEDGQARPFNAVIETPQSPNTVAIRNIGQIEFPLAASLIANDVDAPVSDFPATSMTVQGGALRTFPFPAPVERVEVMLKTDGRPLNARIELLQGPNNNKQVIELYADDGLARPFFAIIDTMGSGNVVRIVNTAPIEFPMTASVQPHFVDNSESPLEPVIGGDQ